MNNIKSKCIIILQITAQRSLKAKPLNNIFFFIMLKKMSECPILSLYFLKKKMISILHTLMFTNL